ncbi:MAG TPA: hypothetical protein P5118_24235, partial [Planctomycetota bacterium]|nr:hypothetical protein [Planctomycetota bacterium]
MSATAANTLAAKPLDRAKRARKSPLIWFGGKTAAGPLAWECLGDVAHLVVPFAGGLGDVLQRPHVCNRTYFSETINDAGGHLENAFRCIEMQPEATEAAFNEIINDLDPRVVNTWRAIRSAPDETAWWASWPVSEASKIARQIAVQKWSVSNEVEHLLGTWDFCNPQMAGFFLYGVACQIGTIGGPWTADPATGRIVKIKGEPGVRRNRPALVAQGNGVNAPQLREPGVRRALPQWRPQGQGVENASLREPGVHSALRTPHSAVREPGVRRSRPHLTDDGKGVNTRALAERGVSPDALAAEASEFHPLVMPKLREWFRLLSARLRHVRIVCGDWRRVLTHGALYSLSVGKQGPAGVLLDPPYDPQERSRGLYATDAAQAAVGDASLAADVRRWCLEHGNDKDLRIVLYGYDGECQGLTDQLLAAGWREYEWFKRGFLTGGMGHQQHRERIYASPQCLVPGDGDG